MPADATPASPPRWTGVAAADRLWEQFDDEYFVFNPASGHTHLLNALGAAVLQLLDSEALTEQQLLQSLREQVGDDDDRLAAALATHLEQLAIIGLIERAP